MIKKLIAYFSLSIPILFLSSCASFKKVEFFPRATIQEMSKDKNIKPFSKILVRWRNYPFKTYQQSIGYTDKERENIKPVNVPYEDYISFKNKVFKIFKEAGLYNIENGTGTLKIDLISFGRWTYSELFSSYLTDTSFIYILPSSIKVNYYMIIEFEQYGKIEKLEKTASIKTTFHFLLFPIYPFASFVGSEKGVLKNMLWNAAADIYLKQKGIKEENNKNEILEEKTTPSLPNQEYRQDF